MGSLVNLLPIVFSLEHGPQRGGRGSRQEVSRAMAGGASGPDALTLLLRLLMTHFDRVDKEKGYNKLHVFGMCNGTPVSDFNREFRVLVSTPTGSERVLSPGTDVVLEMVRVAANEQFLALLPALTLVRRQRTRGHTPRWMLWGGLFVPKRLVRQLPSTAKHFFFFPCFFGGTRSSAPSGPRPVNDGRDQGRLPSQLLSWQTGSSHHPTVIPIDNSSNPWLDHTSNCWPLEEHHCADGFAVSALFNTDDPPLWSGLLSPRPDALRENLGRCPNCHEDNHFFKHCRYHFIYASGCLNPELGQLGDDDAHRREQTFMVCYRRDKTFSHPNNKKNRTHLSGQSRGYQRDQGHVNCHNDTTYTSDHHGAISRSPAPSAPAPSPRMRFGAAHNPGENTYARQPSIFRTGNRQLDGGTAPSTTLSLTPLLVSEDARVPFASRSNNAAQMASVKSPGAPRPSADDSHGVVPAAGSSASSVVPPSQVVVFDSMNARFQRRSPRS